MYQFQKTAPSQLNDLAHCHAACFPDSLSVQLGTAYIAKTFEWFLVNEHRFLFHIKNGETIIGYCGGFITQYAGDGSTSGMMQFAMTEAIKGVIKRPWLLLHREVIPFYPLIGKNLWKKIISSAKTPKPSPATANGFTSSAGLVVIGILPEHRGKGVFEMLMQQFDKEVHLHHTSRAHLSVKNENARAIQAYTKAGWQTAKTNEHTIEMHKYVE
jgi:ribosomal protein S18 acetylase RimI-like enzyme